MAAQISIEFNSDGFREILMSDGTRSLVQTVAQEIQARANAGVGEASAGFSATVWQGGYGGGRWVGSVTTTDKASIIAEAENKVLTGAVG